MMPPSQRLLRSPRAYFAYGHDITMATVSFVLAVYLRMGNAAFDHIGDMIVQGAVAFAVIAACVFWFMRLYQGVWRYASMNDLVAIAKATSLVVLIFLTIMFAWTRLEELPRSIPFINWLVLMALLGGPRVLYRLIKDRHFELRMEREGRPRIPVLLAGAGDGAELFIRALGRDPEANYRIVGIIAEHGGRVGRNIQGFPVLGTFDDLADVTGALKSRNDAPQRLILTRDDVDGPVARRLLDEAGKLGMSMARLPRLTDFKSGEAKRLEVRPIAIEDLLGRPQTKLDRNAMARLIAGRRVLITGAGGSIGSELVRQLSDLGPSEITLLDASEYNLYSIDLELSRRHPDLARNAVIADIRDADRLSRIFGKAEPELVFHAAALKHVPLVESNPIEGLLTNVVGTRRVADACRAHGVNVMVQISTDKAVNPTNVMGATKRLAENYCQALDLDRKEGGTHFVTVRFGNVLGSTGSVVPLFTKQLQAGGPITVTHPDMTRYFMTIPEAVELILQASAMGSDGHEEAGKIFVLDMGEPVKIVDLANQMIRLAGLEPGKDIEVAFTGPRPGEKLFEEVFHGAEPPMPTEHPGVLLAAPRNSDAAALRNGIDRMAAICREGNTAGALTLLRELVPEYSPESAAS
ncbi:MAG: polysaccharide biosynthesis protein [Rhodospirillales bacterium]|nr:polysaccharide biosynthesis protein [Rhodospirillales bacterium]